MSVDFVALGSVIIDDIVRPDGMGSSRHFEGVLGGGGVYAVAGIRLWRDDVALLSAIGQDLPAPAGEHLLTLTPNVGLLVRPRDMPQPRAWQIFDTDERRTEVFRTDIEHLEAFLPTPQDCPPALKEALGIYLLAGDVDRLRRWVSVFSERKRPVFIWEPWDAFMQAENRERFARGAALVDIVSPNCVEGARLTGEESPLSQIETMLDLGVRCVALRCGEAGSIVALAGDSHHHIPAAPALDIVDVTGAGNAYCGGFLVGWVESGGDGRRAGAYGAVSASFALEQFGPPHLTPSSRRLARERLQALYAEQGA